MYSGDCNYQACFCLIWKHFCDGSLYLYIYNTIFFNLQIWLTTHPMFDTDEMFYLMFKTYYLLREGICSFEKILFKPSAWNCSMLALRTDSWWEVVPSHLIPSNQILTTQLFKKRPHCWNEVGQERGLHKLNEGFQFVARFPDRLKQGHTEHKIFVNLTHYPLLQ